MALMREDMQYIQWVQCEWISCNKAQCHKCHGSRGGHGPYWRGYYTASGKRWSVYIGRTLPDELRHLVNKSGTAAAPAVPKSKPRPAAARYIPPAEMQPAYLLDEAEGMLGLRPGYNRETLRKKLWNKLALRSCTTERANELLACANVILKWHGWKTFGQMCRGKQETQFEAH